MKVAIVAPRAADGMWGGAERAVAGLRRALATYGGHEASVVEVAVDETALGPLIDAYEAFHRLDLSGFDCVISTKYPAWTVTHPNHVVYLFHRLRGLYDTYDTTRFGEVAVPQTEPVAELLDFLGRVHDAGAFDEFFDRFRAIRTQLGDGAPDLAFPGAIARVLVHWLDDVALGPDQIRSHFAISRTVAERPGYFPPGIVPRVLRLPSDLAPSGPNRQVGTHLFTASRLDAPKRLDLLVDAMAYVGGTTPLVIAGTGPERGGLESRAAGDPRITFADFVGDDELVEHYRSAIAVPFVPKDEDLGLITLEAAHAGSPTITCADSGGPTEFVRDGVNGLVARPTPQDLGRAIDRVVADPVWARRLGAAARRRAEGITWEGVVRGLVDDAPRPAPNAAGGWQRGDAAGTRPRVLVLSTYGIDAPTHGGEIRLAQLCRGLAATADVDVLALAADPAIEPGTAKTRDIAPGLVSTVFARSRAQAAHEDLIGSRAGQSVTDVLAGVDAHLTQAFLHRLETLASRADLVVLEQPFLHPAVQRIGRPVPFVLDVQNVEFDARSRSLPESPLRSELLDRVAEVEGAALADAAAVSVCSAADAARLAELYDFDGPDATLVPNGTTIPRAVPTVTVRRRRENTWLRRYRWNGGSPEPEHLAVFFGSWHPPNLDAAELLVELADAMPRLMVLSVGAHGGAFAAREVPRNLVFTGAVSNWCKDALMNAAGVALNPMRIGSGSNLKLIEFLGWGVPTVSTRFGIRGFDLEPGRHLLVTEPEGFRGAVRQTLDDPVAAYERVDAARAVARQYDWEVIGRRFARWILQVLESPAGATRSP